MNNLIGLKNVKSKVNDLIIYQKVQKMREKEGLNAVKSTFAFIFLLEILALEKQLLLELLEECTTNWDFYPKDIF